MILTVAQLAQHLEAELVGKGDAEITGIGPIVLADGDTVTFASDKRRRLQAKKCAAAAVIVDGRIEDLDKPQLVVKDVNAALIEALNIFAPPLRAPVEGIDASAKVAERVEIGKGVSVGANVVIDEAVVIADNTVISSGCRIGQNSTIGSNSRLDCNVVVYHNCTIGNNVIIQANSTIGSTGFGYAFIDGQHRLIPHNGTVVIEDFVEIGANCCVDRAKFGQTRIGAGTKIDNLVQIAHNVVIGKCCLIVSQVGISGSCVLGDGVVLGGQVGLADNIEIGDGAMVAAQSGLFRDVEPGKQMLGSPAFEKREAFRNVAAVSHLPKLVEQLKRLVKRVDNLEAAKDDTK